MAKQSTNSVSSVKPTAGYVLLEPQEATKQTTSGIYLPDSATGDKPQEGTVLSHGGSVYDDGKEIVSPVKNGDKVIYKKWGGNEVKIDGKEYLFVKFEDILAVIS
jgi:chaperonin GroES